MATRIKTLANISDDNVGLVSSINSINDPMDGPGSEYRVYKRRWFILIVTVLLNFSNAMIWITFAPIADKVVPYYSIDPIRLNMLVLVFSIASVPFGFLASWLLDTLGLRLSFIIAAVLNALGSFLRNVSTFDSIPVNQRYTWCLIGQILAACSQPFIMFAPTKLAAVWFAGDQRATANMMASMANPLGILVTNLIMPAIVNKNEDIPTALWVITAPAFLVLLMTVLGVCSSVPPTPPTSSAADKSEPFFQGLKKIAKNRHYWVLNFVLGAGLALFTCMTSFLDQMLCPRGYSDNFAGLCGALMIGAGIIGAVIAGIYVDKTKKFEEVVKICWGLSVLFSIAFTQVSRLRDEKVLIAVTTALFGGFGFAVYPICMELIVETTYPVAEATSAGLAIISGQMQGIVYIILMQFITQELPAWEKSEAHCGNNDANGFSPEDWTVPNLFANCVAVFALLVLLLFFKAEYRRMNAEQAHAAEKILHIDREINHVEVS